MCIGPFAPQPKTPAVPKPIAVPQDVVNTTRPRQNTRRLAGGPGQNRTILSGILTSPPSAGSSILG